VANQKAQPSAIASRAPREYASRQAAHGGEQPDRVPVSERLAQPRVDLARVERGRERLRQHGVPAHLDGREDQAAEHHRPSVGPQTGERDAERERRQPCERAVRLDPRVAGLDRPADRQRRERDEDREDTKGDSPRDQPGPRAEEHRGRTHQPREDLDGDLDGREGTELQAALALERDRGEQRPEDDGRERAGAQARQRDRPRGERKLSVSGGRGHGSNR
jgi:hypothetical protein